MSKYTERFRQNEQRRQRFEQSIEDDCRKRGHARPRSRREFLSRGLTTATSTVFLPSLATMYSQAARAECLLDDNPALGAGKIPFLGFDQAGGANIAGSNFMVGGAGGQEDFFSANGYAGLGLPQALIPQTVGVDRSFGVAMHPNSALLRGMLDKTSAATRLNVNGTVIPARSENDTGDNPHNPIFGIARSGANGEFAVTVGTNNSESGGESRAPDAQIVAAFRPTRVRNRNDAVGLAGGDNAAGFPNDRVAAASSVITALKLGQITEAAATKELVQCGFDKTTANFSTLIDAADLDPNVDPILQTIFPGNELTNGDFVRAAAAMKVVVNGFAGAGTIEFGNRDYHQDPRSETDEKDFVVGQAMGASLEYAAQLGKPLMIYGFSDGALSADGRAEDDGTGVTKFRWDDDDSQTAASFILVYSPVAQPVMRNGLASQQIGAFTNGGSVDRDSSPFANSVTTLAEMVVLNYLALHGQEATFDTVLTNPGLGNAAAAAPFIAFNSIV